MTHSSSFPRSFDHSGFCRVLTFNSLIKMSVNPEFRQYVTLAMPRIQVFSKSK